MRRKETKEVMTLGLLVDERKFETTDKIICSDDIQTKISLQVEISTINIDFCPFFNLGLALKFWLSNQNLTSCSLYLLIAL